MKDFFISYTGDDVRWAEWIAWQLEQAGYSVVLQAWDFRGNWVLRMDEAMAEATRTAVLSPEYFQSGYTPSEWANAFRRDPRAEEDLLIPVRIKPVELPPIFAQITYVDFVGVSEEAAAECLLQRVRRERRKPSAPPAFPAEITRTIAAKPPYPAEEHDRQRVLHARELPVRWRELYGARAQELQETMAKLNEWRHDLPETITPETQDALNLAVEVGRNLRAAGAVAGIRE
jgi:hypothetical protein